METPQDSVLVPAGVPKTLFMSVRCSRTEDFENHCPRPPPKPGNVCGIGSALGGQAEELQVLLRIGEDILPLQG